jgi:nickel/cobalt exporter
MGTPGGFTEPLVLAALGAGREAVVTLKRASLIVALLAALLLPAQALAHPLGNFTINRFSRIEVSGHRVYVLYVLDMAEIPTFQAGKIDPAAYAKRLAAGAKLVVDGRAARLTPVATALAHPPGAGGLRTTRLEVSLRGPELARPVDIRYRDTNYADRIGWKEIVVGVDTPSRSDELRAYPKDLLQSPLDVTTASTRLAPAGGPDRPPVLTRGAALQAPDRVADSGFARLIAHRRLGIWVVIASLAAALFWGAAHALSPGHGKTIVTAYLVGQRGTARHAALLGLIVTATHTAGVFTLGVVTLLLSRFIVPDHLYPWLNLATGVLVVGIGLSVLASRLRHRRAHAHHAHHHHHDHHAHGEISRRSLVAVGISGGLLPCPSALVVLLAAISLHRVAFGLILIVAFSAGLALSITGIGLVAVIAKRAFGRLSFDRGVFAVLPALSALVIVIAGALMTLHAIPKVR